MSATKMFRPQTRHPQGCGGIPNPSSTGETGGCIACRGEGEGPGAPGAYMSQVAGQVAPQAHRILIWLGPTAQGQALVSGWLAYPILNRQAAPSSWQQPANQANHQRASQSTSQSEAAAHMEGGGRPMPQSANISPQGRGRGIECLRAAAAPVAPGTHNMSVLSVSWSRGWLMLLLFSA